ncbi:MAG: hypothetical protein MJE77_16990 [Proteobacteria bacterium]|nr:hypothetical protein [Pseudomonadota bacterium]
MSIRLTNISHRIRSFHLLHESYCTALGQCSCVVLGGREPRRVAASLVLPANIPVSGLAEPVLELAKVQRAIRAGEILVERPPAPTIHRKQRTRRRVEPKKRESR